MKKTWKSTTIIIFGASGDLTRRKLIPSLYNTYKKKHLHQDIKIVGFARRPYNDEIFRNLLEKSLKEFIPQSYQSELWQSFSKNIHYFKGNLTQPNDFSRLDKYLKQIETVPSNRLYYLATSPSFFETTVKYLGETGMIKSRHGEDNIVIEKPFGNDLESAKNLNSEIHKVFAEDQIFRIDHYLGKETAQNILFLRFANTIFEPIWDRRYISNVQITVAESVDVGHRAGYYDKVGVLRDMFQNHLMQLLTLIAMEPPASFKANELRNEKVKVLQATRPINLENVILGQYDGYVKTEGVSPNSRTPTYASIKMNIDNWRWEGVSFYLRSGKAMKRKTSEITIEFQAPPHLMFDLPKDYSLTPNILSICIQPDEGIHLAFEAKVPGTDQETQSVDMEFHYSDTFQDTPMPDAYERLILDALEDDASLFARNDEIETAWKLFDPVIKHWEDSDNSIHIYPKGSWGPSEADQLLKKEGHIWRLGCGNHKNTA